MDLLSQNNKIQFSDLYQRQGLLKLDAEFYLFFQKKDPNIFQKFQRLKDNKPEQNLKTVENINILLDTARILESFLATLFNIEKDNEQLQAEHHKLAIIYQIRRNFIQKQIARKYKTEDVANLDIQKALNLLKGSGININPDEDLTAFELSLSNTISICLEDLQKNALILQNISDYCAFALYHPQGQKLHEQGALFKLPAKPDFENLIQLESIKQNNLQIKQFGDDRLHKRDGFKLTDPGFNLNQALKEANYCIFCHNQGKDSCSIGLKEKDNSFKVNSLQNELSGCPLEERISEMNLLKSEGFSIAALAFAVIDNPMIAATGHRICNDCMKSCIYQKQDPVNIPQVETKILKDVLHLPYGFEIYSLLTRWNPLNLTRPVVKPESGYKVLVAGLGPAGFTLAHHLLNEGHLVVAIDGLKIEPLDPKISGIDLQGKRYEFEPIKDINTIYESLDQRTVGGFGGVAEYGITVRWDKNFLKVIRLLLERRENFRMFGGFRLGSGFDCKDLFDDYNFDHIALCLGAGRPNIIDIKNNFAKGIRSASDFLMALQLTGAAGKNLITNLQVRLPITVLGAGLTAIDTACESLAYYALQAEKFYDRYQILLKTFGKAKLVKQWDEEDHIIAEEMLKHGKAIKEAKQKGENINLLLRKWGGATILYRKSINDAPAYRLNDYELSKAFEEGIRFIEEVQPTEAVLDQFNYLKALKLIDKQGKVSEIEAKTLFFAAGTSPNKAPAYEGKLPFTLNGNSFQIIDFQGNKLESFNSPKAENIGFLAAKDEQSKKTVSFFGDSHPSFAGSVVKAMASAKQGYLTINHCLAKLDKDKVTYRQFLAKIQANFTVLINKVNILSDYVFELEVYAPLLAKHTELGHIFRLHNYHCYANSKKNTLLAMESVAVTTYKVDKQQGLISVIVINTGGSSSIVQSFKKGDPLIFMGPGGTPTPIKEKQTVMLIAGGRGVFPLASLAKAYKESGCKVIFFSGYKQNSHIVNQKELEDACNTLIISSEEQPKVKLNRPQDRSFQGLITDAVIAYGKGKLGKTDINYKDIDLIMTMGGDEMMHKVAKLRHKDLKDRLNPKHIGVTSLNNPMQCMMKGICSQCLQKKTRQNTGETEYFYSCINQDQKLDEIDFNFLKNRCTQNSLQEKLTRVWLEYVYN